MHLTYHFTRSVRRKIAKRGRLVHKREDGLVTAAQAAAAAATEDKEVTHPSDPVTRKDTPMAATSPEVGRCHVHLKGGYWMVRVVDSDFQEKASLGLS